MPRSHRRTRLYDMVRGEIGDATPEKRAAFRTRLIEASGRIGDKSLAANTGARCWTGSLPAAPARRGNATANGTSGTAVCA